MFKINCGWAEMWGMIFTKISVYSCFLIYQLNLKIKKNKQQKKDLTFQWNVLHQANQVDNNNETNIWNTETWLNSYIIFESIASKYMYLILLFFFFIDTAGMYI